MRGILLIVIDCLRADHVSGYGYARQTTPTLDQLARNGQLWDLAFSTSSWTKPSVTSMLTGLYPTEHGAFEGIKRSRQCDVVTTDRMRNTQPTLSEKMSAGGRRCAAFVNNAQLGDFTGLDRGFDEYVSSAGKADRLIGLFEKWVTADPSRPFFAYLHFLEAHWPYKPRRRHVAAFGGDRDTNAFGEYSARDYGKLRKSMKKGERTLDDGELDQIVQMYDGAVRRLDGKIKTICNFLSSAGLKDQCAMFITADHGEEFLEHGSIGHGHSLHDEVTHVPLIASIPGDERGVRHAHPVSLADLSGTLLKVADSGPTNGYRDIREPTGADDDRPVFGELRTSCRYRQSMRTRRWKMHREWLFDPSDSRYDRNSTPRQLVDRECPAKCSVRLFDVENDPSEQKDLTADPTHDEIRRALEKRFDGWWWGLGEPTDDGAGDDTVIDSSVVERIHNLGYID